MIQHQGLWKPFPHIASVLHWQRRVIAGAYLDFFLKSIEVTEEKIIASEEKAAKAKKRLWEVEARPSEAKQEF